jgi:hypothetical protein
MRKQADEHWPPLSTGTPSSTSPTKRAILSASKISPPGLSTITAVRRSDFGNASKNSPRRSKSPETIGPITVIPFLSISTSLDRAVRSRVSRHHGAPGVIWQPHRRRRADPLLDTPARTRSRGWRLKSQIDCQSLEPKVTHWTLAKDQSSGRARDSDSQKPPQVCHRVCGQLRQG